MLILTPKAPCLSDTIAYRLWNNAKFRAHSKGVPFDITVEDILPIPNCCPILGIPIEVAAGAGKGSHHDNSPSLDRIFPDLGYTVGNILVISSRANRLKNQATPEELESLAKFFRQYSGRR